MKIGGTNVKRVAVFLAVLFWVYASCTCARAEQLDFENGQVTFFAVIEAPEGLTEARELICEPLHLESKLMCAAFGIPEEVVVETRKINGGSQYYSCAYDDVCLNSLFPIFYSYDRESGRLLRGYTSPQAYQAAGTPELPTEHETLRLLQEMGLTLCARRSGSQMGKAVNEKMCAEAEDLQWEKNKSGDQWHELPDDVRVSRYECVQMLEEIPLYQYARALSGTDSFTYECETILYFIADELVYFSGGVYSAPVEYGEMSPLISAQCAAEIFADDYNLLVDAKKIFCDTIRLEYMIFPESGSLIYSRWRLEPVWVFYESIAGDQEHLLGGVHALTGEVIAE